jgi:hypothetical protein
MNIKLPMSKHVIDQIQNETNIITFQKYSKLQTEMIDYLINEGYDESDVISFFCQHIVQKLGYAPGGRTIDDFFSRQR